MKNSEISGGVSQVFKENLRKFSWI